MSVRAEGCGAVGGCGNWSEEGGGRREEEVRDSSSVET